MLIESHLRQRFSVYKWTNQLGDEFGAKSGKHRRLSQESLRAEVRQDILPYRTVILFHSTVNLSLPDSACSGNVA